MHLSNLPPCRITDSQQCKKKTLVCFFSKAFIIKKCMIQNFKNFTVVQESVGTSLPRAVCSLVLAENKEFKRLKVAF